MDSYKFKNFILSQIKCHQYCDIDDILDCVTQLNYSSNIYAMKNNIYIDWELISRVIFHVNMPDNFKFGDINFYFVAKFLVEQCNFSYDCYNHKHKDLKLFLDEQLSKNDFGYLIRNTTSYLQLLQEQLNNASTKSQKRKFTIFIKRTEKKLQKYIDAAKKEQVKILDKKFKNILTYRSYCSFSITNKNITQIKGYEKLKKMGWYHPINNPYGVVKDHRYSIYDGFNNRIDVGIIGHINNCEFLTLRENSSKGSTSSLTLNALLLLIKKNN